MPRAGYNFYFNRSCFSQLLFCVLNIPGRNEGVLITMKDPGKAGYFFPHDEFYDDGLREAIRFVCDSAPDGSMIAHETPAVTHYYLEQFGRNDLNSRTMSAAEFDPKSVSQPAYFILQPGRTYFENQEKLVFIRSRFRKIHEVQINGATAAEIYTNQ